MKSGSLFTDGAARGNPGPAGLGFVLFDGEGEVVFEGFRYLGKKTNNQAEYHALIDGLKKALELQFKELNINLDSELAVKQVKGEYRVKNEGIKPLYQEVMALLAKFENYNIMHIVREKNKTADKLANRAIDNAV